MSSSNSASNSDVKRVGHEIFKKYDALGPTKCFQRITEDDITKCGGRETFIQIFIQFYEQFLNDPETSVLFDRSDPDSNVDAQVHGTRLALWYLARYGGDSEYEKLRGSLFSGFGKAHKRAMGCPHRPLSQRGGGFTVDQRDLWLGYQYNACLALNISEAFTSKLMGLGAGYGMGFIAIASEDT